MEKKLKVVTDEEVEFTAEFLKELPKPPSYFSRSAKRHYKQMGEMLIARKRVKDIYINALQVYAQAAYQFEMACVMIEEKNNEKPGSGFIQTFRTGATNVTTEVSLKNDAADTLFKCFKIFGLDPKSEKDLKETGDPNQTNLFEEIMRAKSAL